MRRSKCRRTTKTNDQRLVVQGKPYFSTYFFSQQRMGKESKQNKAGRAITAKSSVPPEASKNGTDAVFSPSVQKELIEEHLPPIGLVFTVIACSGFLLMFAFRDVFATGRNIGGEMDDAYLVGLLLVNFLSRISLCGDFLSVSPSFVFVFSLNFGVPFSNSRNRLSSLTIQRGGSPSRVD